MANSAKKQAEKKSGPQHEERPKKEPMALSVERFHDYPPLNVSLDNLYKEVRQVERFPKPKAI